ncbi:BlaI/MecI/CopY family transcriptional regulator [Alienimonas sp. DA493]|uniref:BlaI/MecI/CopY family transcriptional regulator n=1 Tax=Alienimonas sp. DA493 TaxID=3373605 RepID=UPI0037551465
MARPPAEELTDRELEVMHAVWDRQADGDAGGGEVTVAEVRDALAADGRDLAHTTVATLVSILHRKGFLDRTDDRRPHRYRAARGFEEVSRSLVGELVRKVFGGSREALLARLVDDRLTAAERDLLEGVLRENRNGTTDDA